MLPETVAPKSRSLSDFVRIQFSPRNVFLQLPGNFTAGKNDDEPAICLEYVGR